MIVPLRLEQQRPQEGDRQAGPYSSRGPREDTCCNLW